MNDYLTIKISPTTVNNINSVIQGIPEDSRFGTGMVFSTQTIVKTLLTRKGSNKFNPTEGCYLVNMLGQSISEGMLKEAMIETTMALKLAMRTIDDYQNSFEIADSEKVYDIVLTKFNFSTTDSTLYITINLVTQNNVYPVGLELGV